jgi:hypothetical protein
VSSARGARRDGRVVTGPSSVEERKEKGCDGLGHEGFLAEIKEERIWAAELLSKFIQGFSFKSKSF